ncbi:MAG: GNAT family N-acetyltransferase [Candidatus Aenigmatarchaeota archaeon]
MTNVKIRDFIPEDMEAVLTFREETGRISFPGKVMDKDAERKIILKHIKKYPGTIKVAEAGGKPIGFIRFQPRSGPFGRFGYVNIIFVEKKYRRQGIGKLLLQEAEKFFSLMGIMEVTAEITNTNINSLEFFRKNGYNERRTIVGKLLDSK